jgi:hypothetical protein
MKNNLEAVLSITAEKRIIQQCAQGITKRMIQEAKLNAQLSGNPARLIWIVENECYQQKVNGRLGLIVSDPNTAYALTDLKKSAISLSPGFIELYRNATLAKSPLQFSSFLSSPNSNLLSLTGYFTGSCALALQNIPLCIGGFSVGVGIPVCRVLNNMNLLPLLTNRKAKHEAEAYYASMFLTYMNAAHPNIETQSKIGTLKEISAHFGIDAK